MLNYAMNINHLDLIQFYNILLVHANHGIPGSLFYSSLPDGFNSGFQVCILSWNNNMIC